MMQIQVNTDSSIEGSEKLTAHVQSVISGALNRFSDHVTRVEVHLTDQNGHKGGKDDQRCVIEARQKRRQPTVVTHEAPTLEQAIQGATDKMQRLLQTALERSHERG